MPQIEQLQLVHWGSLRPDPIELDPAGINVATGGNGTGKTCLLDAAKLILGVDQLKQKSVEYIFDGRGDPARRAERAYIKAIFRNPIRSPREGRIFADAGRGCEHTEHVTAICEISHDGQRRYTILAGPVTWGENGRRLESELHALNKLGQSHWLRPRQWSELLARAGVSRALLGVISVKQGETDRTIEGTPEDLLKRMLELTGKQKTLDEFRQARAKLAKAHEQHRLAHERLLFEQRELERLKAQAARHEEYLRTTLRYQEITELELPTARRRAREREGEDLRRERDQRAGQLQQAIEEIEALERELPALQQRLEDLEAAWARLTKEADAAPGELERLVGEAREASLTLAGAQRSLTAAEAIADPLDYAALTRFEREAAVAGRVLVEAEREHERKLAEIEQLERGKSPRPDGLENFRSRLEERGIMATLLADELDVVDLAVAAEAVLDRGVWTLVVPAKRYEEAVELAREQGYRLPLARAGDGTPDGILAVAHGAPGADAYLAEIDLPMSSDGGPGVAPDGLVRGRWWAHLRAPEQPTLGERARREALTHARTRIEGLERALPELRTASRQALERVAAVAAGLDAASRINVLAAARYRADACLKAQRERVAAASRELTMIGPELGRLGEEVKAKYTARANAANRRIDLEPRVQTQSAQIRALEEELAHQPLTPEQAALGDLPLIEALEHELERVVRPRLATFSDEERSPMAPIQRDDQALAVNEAEEYLAGRDKILKEAQAELERARKRYEEHIRQTMQALNRSFKEVCEQAGMEGEIKLEPSPSVEGEWSLDVRVAHTPGEPKQPYQSREHSGGQRAKISILLLLAAMSIEGSADLLIMDEHIAHLDSQNIDYVAEVMSALKGKVQFLLATPTNAEAGRLTWCDHQLAFLPRPKGEPYSPSVRLFTRLAEAM
jgi:chromosome segregation ATPase